MTDHKPAGKTTLSPEVLVTIAKMSALSVPGVSRLSATPDRFDRFFKRGANEGVELKVEDGLVYLDLFLVLKPDVNVREVGRNVQHNTARAIEEMIGMDIGHVNIHIEDVDYTEEA
jgi:uncharacterized alkaline shock family protein YloU